MREWWNRLYRHIYDFLVGTRYTPRVPPDRLLAAADRMERAADVMNGEVDDLAKHEHPLEELIRRVRGEQERREDK